MFIRELKMKKKDVDYKYYKLVESFATVHGPRQRDILVLKNFKVPKNNWKTLVSLVKDNLQNQKSLSITNEELIKLANEISNKIRLKEGKKIATKKEVAEVIIDEVRSEYHRELGPVYVGKCYWEKIGISEILSGCGFNKRQINLALISVLNRLVDAGSELYTTRWYKLVALAELFGEIDEINENSLYRVSDKLIINKDKIEENISQKEADLFSLEETIILYDLTSTYFEGKNKSNQKSRFGYSRDKRSDCVQLVVGLVLDREGFVKKHKIYEGNTSDSKTLIDMIKELEEKLAKTKQKRLVVVDRGMSTPENLDKLSKEGYNYIVATRQSELKDYLKEYKENEFEVIKYNSKTKNKVSVSIIKKEKEQYLLCKSTSKSFRDKDIRVKLYQKIDTDLGKLAKRVKEGKLTNENKINEAIGKIKERYSRVVRRYEIMLETNKGKKAIIWSRDEKFDKQMEYIDGAYLLRTNNMDLNKEEICEIYTMLTRVESAFRHLKSDLGIRPNYHQKEFRCDGHIFISMLAYHILHAVEYTLRMKEDTRSWPTICAVLSTHQVSTIVMPSTTGLVHHIRIVSSPEPEHIEIYKRLGLNPYPIVKKRYVAKT